MAEYKVGDILIDTYHGDIDKIISIVDEGQEFHIQIIVSDENPINNIYTFYISEMPKCYIKAHKVQQLIYG